MIRRRARCRDEGSAAIEFTIWVPAGFMLLALAMVGGRIINAGDAVDAAAADAAREASLAPTAAAAQQQAGTAAAQTLADQHLHCASVDISVDTSGFDAPIGQYGAVTASVHCRLTLSDLGLPVSGGKDMSATFTSVIDRWRPRT
ncbi:Flp pilus assembly protein TadG [Kitasatospora sp. MAP12-15]|uniref:TadE/TadG family type IV pilus assembly protein n=1 Tax=unclassified Kitasatospora TaxID=2633591 RepID=UPI002476DB6A|nr:TadE/TadG family type IV pilus assembly protein [Kitasatospora sp. MAP12-44]MDH6115642.1 Flp pilus assembly protein TadG [Kitasatospora sp. MAP12-44]